MRSLLHLGLLAALAAVIFPAAPIHAFAKSNRQSEAEMEALNKRVMELYNAGKVAEAILLAERYLKLVEGRVGESAHNHAAGLSILAVLYTSQGRYAEAEPLYKRALTIVEKALPNGPEIATISNNLAGLYKEEGRYAEAESLYKLALLRREETLPEMHPDIAVSVNNLAVLYLSQGRYAEAEPLYKRALAMREKTLPEMHPDVAVSINNLGVLYYSQGRYAEAEPLFKRALKIRESVLPDGHPEIAVTLNNLALLYDSEHRYAEAEPLYQRTLAIFAKALPEGHPTIAGCLGNLAQLFWSQGRYADAEELYRHVLEMQEKTLPEGHPYIAQTLSNLAAVSDAQGHYANAEQLLKRALSQQEKTLPNGHPDIARNLYSLATLYNSRGRYADAEPPLNRALAAQEAVLPKDDPEIAATLGQLAILHIGRKEWERAVICARRAVAIVISRALVSVSKNDRNGQEIQQNTVLFRTFLTAASHLNVDDPALRDESFQMAQWAARTQAAGALSQMTARLAAGSGPLAEAVRSLQDMESQWQAADKQLSKALGEGNKTLADSARQQMADLDARMKLINARLRQEFPRYAELSGARPASIADAQEALRPNEALVTFTFVDDEAYLFVVRKELAKFITLPVKRGEVAALVADLRDSLDDKGRPFIELPPFDAIKAHQLYQKLLGPADAFIRDAAHLIVVPDGPLQSLPPTVLVTEAPKGPIGSYGDYREVAWLVRRQAISIVPAASSLVSLRRFAAAGAQAQAPFAGFGDPDFSGKREAEPVKLANLFRGAQASIENVRALPRLADTADELRAEAEALHAPETSVYLGAEATVTKVKSLDLSKTKVVSFATHGLIAGELPKLAEPALAFTPPKEVTPDDDGLLRASDVAQLKLNADFVVLSACNTAAADGTVGAEGLSGLAKAFFYAGAKSLLVSHWPVNSAAAVKLTTGTFNALADDPSIGRAQALRRSMLAMIDPTPRSAASPAPDNVLDAHPLFWAPFVLVGEGEGGR